MPAQLPLPALLSQALVAFTIEFDNEFEHQMPHRTTRHGSTGDSRSGPWLVSLVMWSNCMRFVDEAGVRAGELVKLARTKTNFRGMARWGYITAKPDPEDRRPKPPRSDRVIRAAAKGLKAREVWGPLFGVIEKRWEERFGNREIDELRESLRALAGGIDLDLPDCLPILGYGLYSSGRARGRRATAVEEGIGSLSLAALLSRVLLAFAMEFERESEWSLAMSANVLRVLDENGVRVRDLPLASGVSKEAIGMALGFLEKRGAAVVETAGRTKVARLTAKGREAQDAYHRLAGSIEKRWVSRFGEAAIRALREPLERLAGGPLLDGLEPYPEGWRASVKKPETLPHYPMVLHRGGFPDGS